jgi:hypothetical protein
VAATVAAMVTVLAAAPGASAQDVRGTVVDADAGRPVEARVQLVDTASVPVDSAVTDSAGRFRLAAPGPGTFIVHVAPPGYLSVSTAVELAADDTVDLRIEMPVISEAAAGIMREAIDREAAFQLPWAELCGEPVRPWEAGVLVGVARDRGSMDPVPGVLVRVEPLDSDAPGWPRTRVATDAGSFWFCNVPPGRVRVTARADGYAPDTWEATIRSGTISWYDALLRR